MKNNNHANILAIKGQDGAGTFITVPLLKVLDLVNLDFGLNKNSSIKVVPFNGEQRFQESNGAERRC